MNARIELLLQILDQAFERKAWHGPTLLGTLRGVTARQALWKPSSGRHSVWELALHTAYWKYAVRRRLRGEKRLSFPRNGSNWFRPPHPGTPQEWRADVRLLQEQHSLLRATIAELEPAALDERSARGTWRNEEMIAGVAAHDLYHAGQIQLLKRLQPPSRR